MESTVKDRKGMIKPLLLSALLLSLEASPVFAVSCVTQGQMTAAQRDTLADVSKKILEQVQAGDVAGIRANTLPAVAADFGGIATSITDLKPLVEGAAITIEALYVLDAAGEGSGQARTDFFCGSPVVVLNFTSLPPGGYALAILHATGVAHPQQISLILAETVDHHWQLAGFFAKPMTEAGHDGLWYWTSARLFAQRKMNWNAWFYYRVATDLLDPVEFLSSPNLQKLQHEAEQLHPDALPGTTPLAFSAAGRTYQITAIETTSEFGALDLDVHYVPEAAQAAQLRDPGAARKQVMEIMTGLVSLHPELRDAFHGIWVHADQGSAALFALELPMDSIVSAPQSPSTAR